MHYTGQHIGKQLKKVSMTTNVLMTSVGADVCSHDIGHRSTFGKALYMAKNITDLSRGKTTLFQRESERERAVQRERFRERVEKERQRGGVGGN